MNTASTRPVVASIAALLGSLATVAWLPGCATGGTTAETSNTAAVRMASSPDLERAVEDFRAARYQPAFDRARTLARTSSPPVREQAAWVAGLAAYQMQMLDEAELQFMAAARSQDARLVTDTRIMIADIRALQRRWSDAARGYREAAQELTGDERARVLDYASEAERFAANPSIAPMGSTGAAVLARDAGGSAPGPAPRAASSSSTAPSSFALQAGAFQNEKNARRRAADISASTRSAGLGDPRVVRTRDRGRDFWAVQIGSFTSRQGAESAKSKLPSIELIVTAAG